MIHRLRPLTNWESKYPLEQEHISNQITTLFIVCINNHWFFFTDQEKQNHKEASSETTAKLLQTLIEAEQDQTDPVTNRTFWKQSQVRRRRTGSGKHYETNLEFFSFHIPETKHICVSVCIRVVDYYTSSFFFQRLLLLY